MKFLAKDWEMFYTDAKSGEEWIVDQISINKQNKTFFMELEENDMCTDGFDITGNEISSWYVSRIVFDCIVEGIKKRGFKEIML